MVCKATSWQEVDDDFIIPPGNLHRYTVQELGLDLTPNKRFNVPEKRFLLVRGSSEYIVDTQGYNYAKYIHRIK